MSDYLEHALTSQQVQARMIPKGIGLQHIHLEDLRKVTVPIPPLAEEDRIVGEVDRRLCIVDEIEAQVDANIKRAARLRQGILKRAFEGRLVPQDPTDEPAERDSWSASGSSATLPPPLTMAGPALGGGGPVTARRPCRSSLRKTPMARGRIGSCELGLDVSLFA